MIVPVPSPQAGQAPSMAMRRGAETETAVPGFATLLAALPDEAQQAGSAAPRATAPAPAPLDALQAELETVAQDGLARLVAAGGDANAQVAAITRMQAELRETISAFDSAHGTDLSGLLAGGAPETGAVPPPVFAVPPRSDKAIEAMQAVLGEAGPDRAVAMLTSLSELLDTAATATAMPAISPAQPPQDPEAVTTLLMPASMPVAPAATPAKGPVATARAMVDDPSSEASKGMVAPGQAAFVPGAAFAPAPFSGAPTDPALHHAAVPRDALEKASVMVGGPSLEAGKGMGAPGQIAPVPAPLSGAPADPATGHATGPRDALTTGSEGILDELPVGDVPGKTAPSGQAAPVPGGATAQAAAPAPLSFSAMVSEAALMAGEAGAGGPELPVADLPVGEPGTAAARAAETAAPTKTSMPAPPPPPSGFSRALTAQIRESGIVEGRTKIALTPGGLGEIEIELSREAGQLKVVIRAENQTVLQALRGDRDGLMGLLAESGAAQDDSQLSFESFERGEREGRGDAARDARTPGGPAEDSATLEADAPAPPVTGGAGDGHLDILT